MRTHAYQVETIPDSNNNQQSQSHPTTNIQINPNPSPYTDPQQPPGQPDKKRLLQLKTTAASSNSRNITQHPAAVYYMAAVTHTGGGFTQRRGIPRTGGATIVKGEEQEEVK